MSEFTKKFKINDHWANYITNTFDYKYNYCEGAYRSSKSVSNTLAFALFLEESKDKLFLVIASTTTSAQAIVEDGDGLGLKYYFGSKYQANKKYKNCPAGYLKSKYGLKTIVYVGGAMSSSFQAFRGWSIGGLVLEELNLLHENTINEAKGRILMAENPKVFISHNPVGKKHPIYKWLDELQTKGLVNYDHSTIYDNPALTEERRQEIIAEFDPDSIFYRQYILGERVDAEGVIYTVRDYNIIDTFNPSDYIDYITVADPGQNTSATGFICLGLKYDRNTYQYEIHVLKEYRHKNSEQNRANVKLPRDYAIDYMHFIKDCINMFNRWPSTIYIDLDITFYRELQNVMMENSMPTNSIRYVIKNDIDERVKQSVNVLYTGKLKFYKECKYTIDTFKLAVYDPKKAEQGKYVYLDEPSQGTEIDLVDATCYGMNHYINNIYNN